MNKEERQDFMNYVLSDIQEGDVYKFQIADLEKAIDWIEAKKEEWELLAKIEMNQTIADYVSDYAITPTYDRIKEMLEYKMRFLIIRNMKWPH